MGNNFAVKRPRPELYLRFRELNPDHIGKLIFVAYKSELKLGILQEIGDGIMYVTQLLTFKEGSVAMKESLSEISIVMGLEREPGDIYIVDLKAFNLLAEQIESRGYLRYQGIPEILNAQLETFR